MADEEKASSLLSDEQHDDEESVEMEFKVADIYDEVPIGWRLATITDVECYMELVKLELCGMTFHICALLDGTVGGPGYGYQITHQKDDTLDHKLLITNPSSSHVSSEVTTESIAMTTSDEEPTTPCPNNTDSLATNTTDSHLNESSEWSEVRVESTSVISEQYNESVDTLTKNNIVTGTQIIQQNSDKILTSVTNDSIEPHITSIQNDIENADEKKKFEVISDSERYKNDGVIMDTVVQSNGVVGIELRNAFDDDVLVSQHDCSGEQQVAVDAITITTQQQHENEVKVSAMDTSISDAVKSVSDLESGKSNESSPSLKKKKKPMSESMQRLTAKKESPESKRSTDLASAAERKAKADELRKQKIIDQRKKDDERRAAVLERRRKLEEAERVKKEALFKKLTTKEEATAKKTSPMLKRYSLSTSNLSMLKKTKPVEAKIDISPVKTSPPCKTENKIKDRVKPPLDRPKSAMHRPTMGLPPDRKPTDNTKRVPDIRRPMTAFGTRMQSAAAKPPSSKPSSRPPSSSHHALNTTQPPRPSTALGISNIDKRRSVPAKQPRPTTTTTTTADKPLTNGKPMQKSRSSSGLATKDTKKTAPTTPARDIKDIKTDVKKNAPLPDKKRSTPVKKEPTKDIDKKEKPKTPKSTTSPREKKETTAKENKSTDVPPPQPKKSKKGKEQKEAKQMTEEEAKKALAERRKKAKEEAEAKAKAEREKDEVERRKREEEDKRLLEQLKLEEERNAALLEQLKKEEAERRLKMIDEKEQREREERERLDEEQRHREDEIERKTNAELDKLQKEQEKQELLLDQERIERKKRVEMIMARVSSKRTNEEMSEAPTTPVETSSPPAGTATPELSTDPARLKVNDILRSRGFGRSSEDISVLLDRQEVIDNETYAGEIINKEITINENYVTNGTTVHEEIDSSYTTTHENGVTGEIPNDESPLSPEKIETEINPKETITREEAPSSFEMYFNASPKTEAVDDIEPSFDNDVSSVELIEERNAMASDDVANYVNHELSENVEDISLSETSAEDINNHSSSLNDTNNNKDLNRCDPIVAWNDNELNTQNQNHIVNVDKEFLDTKLNSDEELHLNGNQDLKVVNGSGDIHIVSSMKTDSETFDRTESDQWERFDERMKAIQPPNDQVPSNDENKLWKVLEGKVELSECF